MTSQINVTITSTSIFESIEKLFEYIELKYNLKMIMCDYLVKTDNTFSFDYKNEYFIITDLTEEQIDELSLKIIQDPSKKSFSYLDQKDPKRETYEFYQ
jgi:hypothetical protein